MKRFFILSLTVLFIGTLMLSGCGKKENIETDKPSKTEENALIPAVSGFQVGFSRVNITPTDPVPLSGYGNSLTRMSNGYLDYLYVSAIAVTDEKGETIFLCGVDTCTLNNDLFPQLIFPYVAENLGIPEDRLFATATHTHSGVDIGYHSSEAAVQKVVDDMKEGMLKACKEAVSDRAPAEVYWAEADLSGYNFVRHYLLKNGEYVGDNFGDDNGDYAGHSAKENPMMQLVDFKREGKKDVIFGTWRAHATITGGSDVYNISADLAGSIRTYLEKQSECYFTYFQGDAGNSNPRSRIAEEDCTRDYKKYGEETGERILAAVSKAEKVENTDIKVIKTEFTGNVDHSEDSLLAPAQQIAAEWAAHNNRQKCVELGRPYGIRSPYHANGIVRKNGLPLTYTIPAVAIAIGDVGIAQASYEMFVENGDYVRENSPFKYTMMMAYSNGHNSYIPSQLAFDYHCYETNVGTFEAGTGEIFAQKFVELLTEVKAK